MKEKSVYQQLVLPEKYGKFVATVTDALKKALENPDIEVRLKLASVLELEEAQKVLAMFREAHSNIQICINEALSTDASIELHNGSVLKLFVECVSQQREEKQ